MPTTCGWRSSTAVTAGGHWLEAYPFVRLHQASAFYGVASTLLGGGRVQHRGPEAGLQERATRVEICAYYERMLADRCSSRGGSSSSRVRVRRRPHVRLARLGRSVRGRTVPDRRRAPPVAPDPRGAAAPVRRRRRRPSRLGERAGARGGGAEPVRHRRLGQDRHRRVHLVAGGWRGCRRDLLGAPRDLWMLNRAVIQPEPRSSSAWWPTPCARRRRRHPRRPVPAAGGRRDHAAHRPIRHPHHGQDAHPRDLGARAAAHDRARRAPRAHRERRAWADRRGRVGRDRRRRPRGALRGEGLRYPPLVPVWRPEAITLQPIQVGLPVLRRGARRYVEATRDDDAEKNRLPADALRRFARRVGAHDRHGRSRLEVLRGGARHHGLGVHGRAEPDAHPTRGRGPPSWSRCSTACGLTSGGLDRLAQLAGMS